MTDGWGQRGSPFRDFDHREKSETVMSRAHKYLKRQFESIGLAAICIGFFYPAHADIRHKSAKRPEVTSEFYGRGQNDRKREGLVSFLPDVNASIEAAEVNGGDYNARVIRKIEFDAFRIRDWFFHIGFQEESLFDPSPSQLDHELEYLGIGYNTANGRIKLLWDHTCNNPSRKLPKDKINGIHWNELGIGYETAGMMLGHKNDGIKFSSGLERLNNINWRASLSKIWMRTENEYEWMLKLGIRDDVFRIGNQVFYVQLGLNSIYDDRGINQDHFLEAGDRIRFNENCSLNPFVSYKHFHDWYSFEEGEDFVSIGIRLELGLSRENPNNFPSPVKTRLSWAPEFHITGGYTNIIDHENYGHSSDVTIDLYLLELDPDKSLGLHTYTGILTLPNDLNPYIVRYDIGPYLEIDLGNFNLGIYHRYSCLYGIDYIGVIRDYNLLGLELRDNNASNLNWDAKIGVYPSKKDFDYRCDLQGSLEYNLYEEGVTPYIHCSSHYLQGNSSVFGSAIEGGIKAPGKAGTFSAYLCHQDDFDVFRFGRGAQTLFGLRIQF